MNDKPRSCSNRSNSTELPVNRVHCRVENFLQVHSTEEREYDVAKEYNYLLESVYCFHRG